MKFAGSHRPIEEALLDWRYESSRATSLATLLTSHFSGICAVARAFVSCGLSDLASRGFAGWAWRLGVCWLVLTGLVSGPKLLALLKATPSFDGWIALMAFHVFGSMPYAMALASLSGRGDARSPLPAFSVLAVLSSAGLTAMFVMSLSHPSNSAGHLVAQGVLGCLLPILLVAVAEETRTSERRLLAVALVAVGFVAFVAGLHVVNSNGTRLLIGGAAMRWTTPIFVILSFWTIRTLLAAWNSRQAAATSGTAAAASS